MWLSMMYIELTQNKILAEALNSYRRDRSSSVNNANPILVVIITVMFSVAMSAIFASYVVGIFQDSIPPRNAEIRVMNIAKLKDSSDKVMWNIDLSIKNRGEGPIEFKYIDFSISGASIQHSEDYSKRALSLSIGPNESRLINLLITNHPDINRQGHALIFVDNKISEGTWITIHFIDDRGNMYQIILQLP